MICGFTSSFGPEEIVRTKGKPALGSNAANIMALTIGAGQNENEEFVADRTFGLVSRCHLRSRRAHRAFANEIIVLEHSFVSVQFRESA